MIYPEVKFLSSCEPVEADKLLASNIQGWDRHTRDTPILQGIGKKEEVIGPTQVQNSARQIH